MIVFPLLLTHSLYIIYLYIYIIYYNDQSCENKFQIISLSYTINKLYKLYCKIFSSFVLTKRKYHIPSKVSSFNKTSLWVIFIDLNPASGSIDDMIYNFSFIFYKLSIYNNILKGNLQHSKNISCWVLIYFSENFFFRREDFNATKHGKYNLLGLHYMLFFYIIFDHNWLNYYNSSDLLFKFS